MTTGGEESKGRRLFVSREFSLLWLGQSFSSFGEYLVSATVIVWFATSLLPTSSLLPGAIAAVVLAASVPRLVVAPFAGTWTDRLSPKLIMIGSDACRAVLFGVTLVLLMAKPSKSVEVVALLALLLMSNCVAQFFNPARAAVMQRAIPENRRVYASSLSVIAAMGVATIATAAGPALYAVVGGIPALVVDLLCFILSGICIFLARIGKYRSTKPPARYWHEFAEGFKVAWQQPQVRLIMGGITAYGLSTGVNSAVLSLFALKTLGLQPSAYGIVSATFSLGGIFGVVLVPLLIRHHPISRLFVIAVVALGVVYLIYALNRSPIAAGFLMLCAGVIFSLYITVQGPMLQESVPIGFMGRVTSVTTPLSALSSLVGTVAVSGLLQGVGSQSGSDPDPVFYAWCIGAAAGLLLVSGLFLGTLERRARRNRVDRATSAVADG